MLWLEKGNQKFCVKKCTKNYLRVRISTNILGNKYRYTPIPIFRGISISCWSTEIGIKAHISKRKIVLEFIYNCEKSAILGSVLIENILFRMISRYTKSRPSFKSILLMGLWHQELCVFSTKEMQYYKINKVNNSCWKTSPYIRKVLLDFICRYLVNNG